MESYQDYTCSLSNTDDLLEIECRAQLTFSHKASQSQDLVTHHN